MSIPWRRILAGMVLLALVDLGMMAHFGTACVGATCLRVQPWAVSLSREQTVSTAEGGWLTTMQVQRWGWVRGTWTWGGMP